MKLAKWWGKWCHSSVRYAILGFVFALEIFRISWRCAWSHVNKRALILGTLYKIMFYYLPRVEVPNLVPIEVFFNFFNWMYVYVRLFLATDTTHAKTWQSNPFFKYLPGDHRQLTESAKDSSFSTAFNDMAERFFADNLGQKKIASEILAVSTLYTKYHNPCNKKRKSE